MSSRDRDSRTHSGSSRSRDDYSRSHRDHRDKYRHEDHKNKSKSRDDEDRSRIHNNRHRSRSPNSSKPQWIDDDKITSGHKYEKETSPFESSPPPPPPPRISKITMGFNKPAMNPVKMSLSGGGSSAVTMAAKPAGVGRKVASVFNESDDDEEEEMPAEARMRMRNIGRETPTSAGPNSFGKTKQGFCDAKKVFEKNMKQAMEQSGSTGAKLKLPQTIYKINPS